MYVTCVSIFAAAWRKKPVEQRSPRRRRKLQQATVHKELCRDAACYVSGWRDSPRGLAFRRVDPRFLTVIPRSESDEESGFLLATRRADNSWDLILNCKTAKDG